MLGQQLFRVMEVAPDGGKPAVLDAGGCGLEGLGVPVDAVQPALRAQPFQDGRRMAAAAQRAVQIDALGPQGQPFQAFLQQHRPVIKLHGRPSPLSPGDGSPASPYSIPQTLLHCQGGMGKALDLGSRIRLDCSGEWPDPALCRRLPRCGPGYGPGIGPAPRTIPGSAVGRPV